MMMMAFIGNLGGPDLIVLGGCCCFGVLILGVGVGVGVMFFLKKKDGK